MLWSILAAGSTHAAEADAVTPVHGPAPAPERRAQEPGPIEEGAAPQHMVLALIGTGGIGLRFA
jgi:hypothetical protein